MMRNLLRELMCKMLLMIMEDEMWFSGVVDKFIIEEYSSVSLHTKQLQNTRNFTGFEAVMDILTGHPIRCYNAFRMTVGNFNLLCQKITMRLNTKRITAEEQLAIFLACIGHGLSVRKLQEEFQHSTETIYRLFKDVLKAILSMHDEYIKLPDSSAGIHPLVGPNSRNYLFKDALGAIDGTHIQAVVKKKKMDRFRNRKGFISQNVLAACSFDMIFQYVAVGWEGSATDARVLRWSTEEGGFQVPNGRYYLADSGYANSSKFLCPYRNHDYHLAQFNRRPISSRYSCPEELYNHRHAQLRNVIERTFGVLKMRFKILKCMPNYKYRKQTLIVMACCILHNFIKMENQPDYILDASANMVFPPNNASSVGLDEMPTTNEANAGDITRTNIKNALWRGRRRTN